MVYDNNVKRYKLFGKTICKIIYNKYYISIIFLHIFKFNIYRYKTISLKKFYKKICNYKNLVLYIDHMLGGGTAVYSEKKIKELSSKNTVVLLQYDSNIDRYIFYYKDKKICVFTKNIKNISPFSHIIINNIVGYKKPFDLLNIITKQKSEKTTIDFMLHDFYCVCPCVHLFKPDFTTCVKNNSVVCTNCQKLNNFPNVYEWQNFWKNFLSNTVDNIIVFSESSKKILTSVYPETDQKIKILPHEVSWVRKVNIKKHEDINILVLGNIAMIKGAEIVHNMVDILPKNVNIIVIGGFCLPKPQTKQFICTGEYDLKNLPDIVEKYQIDIAFIPSIVPETFSFTTSECMNMGLPVACFDLGAPAERVSKYKKGLVISEIDANVAIKEILNFVKQLKKRDKK